jgi:glycosyltransferase involved in cell wall biosynthesis
MLDVKEVGIEKVSIELNNSSFDDFIRNLQPTLVLFDRFMVEEQFGWRVAKECPDALRILDTEDLHCLRAARQIALKEKREFTPFDLFSDIAKREIASILRCDLSLIISLYEMELLTKIIKIDPALLLYLPFLLDPILPEISNQWPSFSERKHFVFIGNFLHAPNWDAVKFLKEEVWPLIRKELPEAELHIYGAYPSQKVLQLNAINEGFHCLGRAENASEVVSKARVCLAPVRFGAGIKGKLVEAMQCGTPSVTTIIGAESMHGDLAWNGFVKNTPEDIAEAAVQLYTDPLVWQQSQKNGITIIDKIYSKSFYRKKLIDQIFHIQATLKDHRLQNFMGAMLMHHTLASTRYMSKWIEEKNK